MVDVIRQTNALAPELPLYITENGAAYPDRVDSDGDIDDGQRAEYLEAHFEAARNAVAEGLPLKGYFIWSLLDNWEWAWGYSRRFGIVHVDYETQKRTPKRSARWVAQFLQDAVPASRV